LVATYFGSRNDEILDECEINFGTQTEQASASLSGRDFTLNYDAANPLNPTPEPTIKGQLFGQVEQDGSLTLSWYTTEFPTQGVRVSKDGQPRYTFIHDVSCLGDDGVKGVSGLANIFRGLSSNSVTYDRVVEPTDSDVNETIEARSVEPNDQERAVGP
jgi:hypothetical protein